MPKIEPAAPQRHDGLLASAPHTWWLWSIRIFLSNATSVCPVKCFMMMPPIRKDAMPTTPTRGAN
eukprot:scaffold211317_cov34-Tisochrysis_lutea.AAC.2